MDKLVSYNPVTNDIIGSYAITKTCSLESIFAQAEDGFKQWSKTDFSVRFNIIKNFTDLLSEHKHHLATIISQETGKAFWDSETEVSAAINKMNHAVTAMTTRTPLEYYNPLGIMVVLAPYNFPLHLPNGHIIPALLSGNSVILKPSDKTPVIADYMVKLWYKAGLPQNILQIVYGFGDLGENLVNHEKTNGVLFTGGEKAGLAIHKALAGRPNVMLALEMGGNNPLIVWNPDNIHYAMQLAVYSSFISGGQRCTCARKLIIPENSADNLINQLIDITKKLIIDTPFADTNPFYSSLIDNDAVLNAHKAVDNIIKCGGNILYQGHTDKGASFFAPIILDVTACTIPDEEIFAPVLQVIRVSDFDKALYQANNTRFGLSAGFIGSDDVLWKKFQSEIKAGIINRNSPTVGASGNAPFGGIKNSGNYRPAGFFSADYCAYPVAYTVKSSTEAILDKFL